MHIITWYLCEFKNKIPSDIVKWYNHIYWDSTNIGKSNEWTKECSHVEEHLLPYSYAYDQWLGYEILSAKTPLFFLICFIFLISERN